MLTDVGISVPLAPGRWGELASSGGALGASRLHFGLPTSDHRWRGGAGSPKPKTFSGSSIIAPWLLALLLYFHSHLPVSELPGPTSRHFSGAQAMWPVCSPGSRKECMLSGAGLLKWSEKSRWAWPLETKLCGEIAV